MGRSQLPVLRFQFRLLRLKLLIPRREISQLISLPCGLPVRRSYWTVVMRPSPLARSVHRLVRYHPVTVDAVT